MTEPQQHWIHRMHTSMLRYWHAPTDAHFLSWLAALLATGLLLSAYSAMPGLLVFGHDEVHYYQDMFDRLAEDGRWINLLLHDFLRSIPPGTWAAVLMVASWVLFYRLARTLTFDAAYSALVASTILLAYPFAEQILWPATAIPAVIIVLCASVLVERGMPHPLIYLLSGVLIFGTLQTYYFLLPLLYLGRFLDPQTAGRRWSLLFSHMLWWVAGSVAGVLAMALILWSLTGHFGPQPAEWRLASPVQDVASLVRNLNYVSVAFVQRLEFFLRQGGVTWPLIVVVFLAALLRVRALLVLHHALLLIAAVVLSYFVFSIPLAPLIHQRSLVAMAVAVILCLAWFPGPSALGRVFGTLLLLMLGHGFSVNDDAYLGLHDARVTYFYNKLQELIPGLSMGYSAIALYGTVDAGRPEAFIFNDPSLIHPIVVTLGATKYLDCRVDSRCDPLGTGPTLATLPFANGQLVFSADAANVGIIRFEAQPR